MLFPSKFTSYQESVINKMIIVLESKSNATVNVNLLYKTLKKEFYSIDEFIFVLDALFAMGYVVIEQEELRYVNRD